MVDISVKQNVNISVKGNNNTLLTIIKNIISNAPLLDVIVVVLYFLGCIVCSNILILNLLNITYNELNNSDPFIWIHGLCIFVCVYCNYYKSKFVIIGILSLILSFILQILTIPIWILISSLFILFIIMLSVYSKVKNENQPKTE